MVGDEAGPLERAARRDVVRRAAGGRYQAFRFRARGHAPEVVSKVERLLYLAEYKRRQSAPGVKITERLFGRDRRYPITNAFKGPL